MERLSILCDEDLVQPSDLPAKILDDVGDIVTLPEPPELSQAAAAVQQGFVWPRIEHLREHGLGLKEFLDLAEEKLLLEALDMADGVKNQAAEILGVKRTTLIEKLKKKKLD
jgi:DNA-binding NtrC family response regulator